MEEKSKRKSAGILADTIGKMPAGSMLVPMMIAAACNTFFPQILNLGSYFSVIKSDESMKMLMCMTLLFTGCQVTIKELPNAIKRGGSHVLAKYMAGAAAYLLISEKFGYGGILGVCSLAILCALTNCNAGLYMGLMETYGDPVDKAARPFFNLNSGPTLSLLTLGVAGVSGFSMEEMLSILAPLIIGIVLNAVDPSIGYHTRNGNKILLPVMGFALGTKLNFALIMEAGFGSIMLFAIVFFVTGPVAFLVDRLLLKRPGYGGMATVSVAANTIMVPSMIGEVVREYQPYVELAMVQISGAVVLSAVLCPMIVAYTVRKFGCPALQEKTG